jgi:hypothetical protein
MAGILQLVIFTCVTFLSLDRLLNWVYPLEADARYETKPLVVGILCMMAAIVKSIVLLQTLELGIDASILILESGIMFAIAGTCAHRMQDIREWNRKSTQPLPEKLRWLLVCALTLSTAIIMLAIVLW